MTTDIASYHLFNGSKVHEGEKPTKEQGLPPIRSILQDISFNDHYFHQQQLQQSQQSASFFTTSQSPVLASNSSTNIKLPLLIPSASIQPIQPQISLGSTGTGSPPLQQVSSPLSSELTRPGPSAVAASVEERSSLRLRKKYECSVCTKNFTTSGHLARHTRIHTGERNHTCPFDGCGAKFSRQDNCMQHFRTHSNKGSRKKSKGVLGRKN